ncbi:MAG: MMPL family transporter [Polyangia bacterium]|jgi:RND superfamily putative drug exporter|nr:MMPL family transporter [Polyangia bacterium]
MLESILDRLTRAIVRHRYLVVILWALLVPLFIYGFTNVGRKLLTIVNTTDDAQSTFVFKTKANRFDKQTQFLALVTLHHPGKKYDDSEFDKTARAVHKQLRPIKCVKALTAYEDLPFPQLFMSKDGHSQVSLIEMDVRMNDYFEAGDCVNSLRAGVKASRKDWQLKDMEVLVSGPPAIDVDMGRLLRKDSQRAETIVGIVALFLLVWMFRSASAAFLPLITALLGVSGSLTVVFFLADYMELSLYVAIVSSMTGLGLGLDYALLYVSRFREERDKGAEPYDAISTSAQTAGKAILGSGILVMMGFGGLLIPVLQFTRSIGIGGILVVFFTLCSTLILLPALLAFWHPTMAWPKWRWFLESHRRVDRFWEWWSRSVLKIPLVLAAIGLIVVGLCGPHLFKLKLQNPRHEAVPQTLESRRGIDRFISILGEAQVYRLEIQVEIRGEGTWDDKGRQKLLLGVVDKLRKWPEIDRVDSASMMTELTAGLMGWGTGIAERFVTRDKKVLHVDIYGKDGSDDAMNLLVGKLRQELPRLFGADKSLRTYVGGQQATFYETMKGINAAIPIMFPTLALCAFIFMSFFFRSVVIPIKALLLNVLSLFSTFGILVLVFQHGHGLWLLGYSGPPPGALAVATPILLFGIVFGVSMDYEVFLMTRIQEAYKRRSAGATTKAELKQAHLDAIHEGMSRTGGIITNAALIMVITFAAFISGTVLPMKEMGFALALAVALDATLVRMMLLPSVLKLLGPTTWYWPGRKTPKA